MITTQNVIMKGGELYGRFHGRTEAAANLVPVAMEIKQDR